MLRQVFLTKNEMTFPVSGTGSAGMEFFFVNLLEPGDEVVIGVNGVFGTRMVDVAERCGAKVAKVEAPWGRIIEPQQIADIDRLAPDHRRPLLLGKHRQLGRTPDRLHHGRIGGYLADLRPVLRFQLPDPHGLA